jgi:hypothetical protein
VTYKDKCQKIPKIKKLKLPTYVDSMTHGTKMCMGFNTKNNSDPDKGCSPITDKIIFSKDMTKKFDCAPCITQCMSAIFTRSKAFFDSIGGKTDSNIVPFNAKFLSGCVKICGLKCKFSCSMAEITPDYDAKCMDACEFETCKEKFTTD